MRKRVYLSRSFRTEDSEVYDAIKAAFEEVASHLDLELTESAQPNNQQLAQRVLRDILDATIVACVFTQRHRIADDSFSAPAYVIAEAGAALAASKQLLVFVEEGIPREELGLVDGLNPQWISFRRDQCGRRDFHKLMVTNIERSISNLGSTVRPPFRFTRYEIHIALYPGGYLLATHKLDVQLEKRVPVRHQFQLYPSATHKPDLPSAAQLYETGRTDQCPYPRIPFTAFACAQASGKLEAIVPERVPGVREFSVHLGDPGSYQYEWMYGTPDGFMVQRALDFYGLAISQRAIDRVKVILRVHQQLKSRREPRWLEVDAGLFDAAEPAANELEAMYVDARRMTDGVRQTPFFSCYELGLNQIQPGVDLMIMY